MLPDSFELPAAIILLAGGLLACLAGYRLFRTVLAIYGFVLGAFIGTSALGASTMWITVAVAVVGGIVGALILIGAYFVGVALVGAGLAAVIVHVVYSQLGREPQALLVIAFAVAGAFGALLLQRYVIIVSTAFGGAWTALVGGLALAGDRAALDATERGDVWIAYPLDPAPGQRWVIAAWLAFGLMGTIVQLAITGKKKRKKG